MRILVAGFQHETNTFAADPADWDAFLDGAFFPPLTKGDAIERGGKHAGLPIAGFLEAARQRKAEIVFSQWAGAAPSAAVTQRAFERVHDAILEDITLALNDGLGLDAIYLDLHGAAVVESTATPEVDLLRSIRDRVGSVPIAVSLDSHANVSTDLLALVDVATCYRTYPHVDMPETGRRAFRLLAKELAHPSDDKFVYQRVPFLIPILAQSTLTGPARQVQDLLSELELGYGCDINFATGFPACDVAACGPAIWGKGSGASAAVKALYERVLALLQAWRIEVSDDRAAVKLALHTAEIAGRPVIVCDPQDNPGAGTAGCTTGLLHALLNQAAGVQFPGRVALGLLTDSEAAHQAALAGVGAELRLHLGASVADWRGKLTPQPVEGLFTVRAIHTGPVKLTGPMMTGCLVDPGLSVCLETEGVLVCVASAKTQLIDRELFRALGVNPEAMKILVVKSAVHFRADFEHIASEVLVAKSPGQMAVDPADLPWTQLPADVRTGL